MNDVPQLTEADLVGMRPEAIIAAQNAGQLADLLAGRKPTPPTPEASPTPAASVDPEADDVARRIESAGERLAAANQRAEAALAARAQQAYAEDDRRQLTADELRGMSPEAIVAAQRAGQLQDLGYGRRRDA